MSVDFNAAYTVEDLKEAVRNLDESAPVNCPDGLIQSFAEIGDLIRRSSELYKETNFPDLAAIQDEMDQWYRKTMNAEVSKSVKAWAGALNEAAGNGAYGNEHVISYRNIEDAAAALEDLLGDQPRGKEMAAIVKKLGAVKQHVERYQNTYPVIKNIQELATALVAVNNDLIPYPPKAALTLLSSAEFELNVILKAMRAKTNATVLDDGDGVDEDTNQRLTVVWFTEAVRKGFKQFEIEKKADTAYNANLSRF